MMASMRGKMICEELAARGVEYVAWIPDSETRFLHVALEADPRFRMIPVCSEGEALTLCAGLHVGGKRGVALVENNGLFDSGNALRWLCDSQLPLVLLVGYLSYRYMTPTPRGRIWNDDYWPGVRDLTEPFIGAFEIPHLLVDSDETVCRIGEAFELAEKISRPVIALLTSADAYVAGT
jgi:sulfopyruvate decarboxylase TPP-binding subunit